MKKFVIKLSLAFVIVIVGFLVLLGFRPRDSFVPSYRFLGGRSPYSYSETRSDKILYKQGLYIYTFEADFNDVCTNLEAELIPEGFVNTSMPNDNSNERFYTLKRELPLRPVIIMIHNNCGYIEKDDTLGPRDGWVMVQVVCWRKRWPF